MNVTRESSNTLLHRKELTFVYPSASNPGYAAVVKALGEKLGVSEDTVVIKRISNSYGSSEFVVEAYVYDSVSYKDAIEPKSKQKKAGGAS